MSDRRDPRERERARGEELARQLPRLEMPAAAAERVRRELRREFAAGRPAGAPGGSAARRWLPIAAGLALGLAAWWVVARPPALELEAVAGPPGGFERLAIEAHGALRDSEVELDLSSSSPAEVRAWLRQDGLSAALAENRPVEQAGRFELLGARRIQAGYPIAAVSYRIDGAPVTLAVTTAGRAPEVPDWSLLGKTVRVGEDPASGAHVLTWRNAGKAYSLVTELPGRGLEACQICHTDSARRELIERLGAEL